MSAEAGIRCLILWLALLGAQPSWAQDSLPSRGSVKPFAVPEIMEPGGGSESLEPIEELQRATPGELRKIRNLALSHYRTAFALDSTSAQAMVSRGDASRVSAGLTPTQTRYACTND